MRSLSTCPSSISNPTFQERQVFTYSGFANSRLKGLVSGSSGAIYVASTDDANYCVVTKFNADLSHSWTKIANQISYENTIAVSADETYVYQSINGNPVSVYQFNTTDGSVTRIFAT